MWIASVAIALGSTTWTSSARASGVDPTRVSLPKGPGSIEGLASADVSPSISTGSASYSIGIEVPPGSAGFGPALSLSYDSGGGVTEIGIGWRIGGVPKLRRRTENGLPRFDDTDAFEIDGVGIPCDLVEVSSGLFRPMFEDGSFVRVERSTDGDEWEARTKAGVTLRFGGAGFEESEGAHTSGYLLNEELDRHGHRIDYEWDATEGRALLTHVTWNDFDPSSKNEVRFGYEARPDQHTLFSEGILETLSRRLHAVEVLHGGALVRRYELSYVAGAHPVLRSIQLVGRDGTSRLPASVFDYTEASLAAVGQVVTMTNPPGRSPSNPDVTLADLDGDGLPDLLVGEAGQFRTYLNHDGKSWLSPLDWGSASPSVSLSQTGVQLADVDADGAADLVVKSGTTDFRYFPRPAATSFGAPVPIATVPTFSFEDPDVRLGDMDGDRRVDVVVTTEAGVAVGYNRGGTDWTEPAVVGVVDANASVRFSDGQTSLCDVNGDRVLDLCSLHSGGMTYWLGRGRGVFQPGIAAQGVPSFDVASPYQLVDVDGDGWVDLLRVDVTSVSIALAVSEGVFGPIQTIDGTPTRTPDTRIELADMNGSGTTDIVWIDTSADGATAWRTLELFPNGRAGLVHRIDDGLGKVQTLDYEPAALQAARARDAGKPWATRPNLAMPVVARVTADFSLGDPAVVTEYSYRDGAYDPSERTFAGFGGSVRRQLGDTSTPTLVTDSTADLGLVHRELRGAPVDERALDDAGNVFSDTVHGYTSRTLATALDGRTVAYSFGSSERVEHVEGGASPTRTTLTEFDQDAYGDVTVERHWGEVSGNDDLVGNDEAIVTRTFANDSDDWLLGYVATEEVTDAGGRRVSLDRKYYDGAPFVGLPVGQVSRGDVSREEAWVGPNDDDVELVIATAYDVDGLPIETKDGRGGGRFYQWAPDRTAILSERVKLESAVTLIETANVDGAFGALLAATDYAGQTTSYVYDAFGRLTAVVKPGDSPELPTTQYTYEVGAPLSRVVTESRVTSGKSDVDRSETLFDGGGRERGTLTRDGVRWILAGVSLFDARGQARRTLIPRSVDDTAAQTPPLLDGTPAGNDTLRDALGREIGTRSPSGIATRTEYAPLVTRHWDGGQSDATTPYEHTPTVELHDGLGRVVGHQRTLVGRTLASGYTYDSNGALLTRTDPEGNVARYDYDGRGRRTAVHDPDLGDHRFSFDAAGDVTSHTYPDGVVARFTYDLASRALTEDGNGDGAPEILRTWDVAASGASDSLSRGKLTRVVEPTGSVEHTYDPRGRITSTRYDIDGASYTVGSVFDAQDREAVHVYPDGSSIAIRRNNRGQIAGYGHAVDIDYGDDGLEVRRRFSTGVTQASAYDVDRRRTELTLAAQDGSVIEHLKWGYDAAGNLTTLSDLRPRVAPADDRSESYGYDNLYRLAEATGTWGKTSYRYSPSGNLTGRTSTVASQSLATVSYGVRPHAPTSFDGRLIDVDERGRMTHDGARAYTWNDADQLVAVANADGSSEQSGYGEDGTRRMRVEHRADGTTTTTHFIDAWSEVQDGKLVRYIVHGGQRIVKLGDDNGAASATTAGAAANRDGLRDARAASAPALGLLCVFAFALTAVLRSLFPLFKRNPSWPRSVVRAGAVGAALAVVCTASVPGSAALALAVIATLCMARHRVVRRASRGVFALGAVLVAVAACSGSNAPSRAADPPGTVQELTDADTLIATDLLGSVLAETTSAGIPTTAFAAYPFGVTRYDTSHATWKFAATPRDGAVGLDHMGARFYAPELGIFTSGDPVALTDPERLITAEFAAANPYVYAKQTPTIAVDRDGHFLQIIGAAFAGAVISGGLEAARQYLTHGKIDDVGRIEAAAVGGAVNGAICSVMPTALLGVALGRGAVANIGAGIAERLFASGGKSAGSLKDVAIDGAVGAATAGLTHGMGIGSGEARGLQRTASVSAARVEGFLLKRGVPSDVARGFSTSFSGPIDARIVEPGEKFARYTGRAFTRGSFLTETTFANPSDAVDGLNLAPYGNPATLRQTVTATSKSIVFEGEVAGGAPGVRQTLVTDQSAFGFTAGVRY